MTKQKLMENFTKEQLVDRIIILDAFFTQSNIFNSLQNDILPPLEKSMIDNYEAQIKQKEAKIQKIEEERNQIRSQRDAHIAEVNELKIELRCKETIINQINDIINELFGVTYDITNNPDELKEILKKKINNSKTLADFLPREPIDIASIFINADNIWFDNAELRQIAEHLLVYCNANEARKEE